MSEIIKQEQGRSMVEMLGVLAVVGVLSVGGIAGYTYAMNKHKTNEVLNGVSARAVVVSAQRVSDQPLSLREFSSFNETAGGNFFPSVVDDIEDGFGIKVTGVKDSVCKSIIKSIEGTDTYAHKDDATLSELTESDCSGNNNEILFVFVAQEGLGATGCPEGFYARTNGGCMDCNFSKWGTGIPVSSEADCEICGPILGFDFEYDSVSKKCIIPEEKCVPGKGWYFNGQCLYCEDGWSYHNQPDEVLEACIRACPNRIIGDDGWGDACRLPEDECDFIDGWGNCKKCEGLVQFWDHGYDCESPCEGMTFSPFDYYDDCIINCGAVGFGRNVDRCCHDDEIYTYIGESWEGHPYGACCPKTRPVWDGSTCQEE